MGMMQPWNFLIIRDLEIKHRVQQEFLRANEEADRVSEDERQRLYQRLTSEAIEQAPINLAVTCDRSRRNPHVLGRHTLIDPDLFVTCCALQNLWLAARAEGVGVGWVNILDPSAMAGILGLPAGVILVGYLCMGHVARFTDAPTLETAGGESRLSLESVLFYDRWGNRASGETTSSRASDQYQ
jgi:5,6-dimethylbenzimidazole synthase